ncbi:MAG: type IV fimbrial biogenesis protein FimT [Halioglobus sp.]
MQFKYSKGFTLIELMAVLAMASALLLIAVPTFQTQIQNGRMSAATTDLLSSLMNARGEAVGRSEWVTLCKRNADGDSCDGSGGWEQGWITFVDIKGDLTFDVGDGDLILQIHESLADPITGIGPTTDIDSIRYSPNGTTDLGGTTTIIFCDHRGWSEFARGVVISIMGKASLSKAIDTIENRCDAPPPPPP